MKKLFLVVLVAIAASTFTASAQRNNMTIGPSLNFSNDVGIGVRFTTEWNRFRLAPDFVLYFPGEGSAWVLDVNAHYMFPIAPKFSLYPLAGLAIGHWGSHGVSDTNFGLNIGGGGEYDFSNRWLAFAEIKGMFGDGSDAVFTLGAAYRF